MKKTFIILLALVFLVPVASGNAGVLFEDNFEDGNRNGWTHIDSDEGPAAGQWVVVEEPSRGYVLEGSAPPYPQYLKLDLPNLPDNFILELEAKTVTDGGISASLFGFYVPWLGWGDGYIGVHRYRPTDSQSFRINQSGLSCVEAKISPQDTSITPFEWHSFKLVKDEDWYTLYYDDNVVFQGWVSTDSSCTDLGGSLVLATSRSNITRYDNIRISTISDVEVRITLEALHEDATLPTISKIMTVDDPSDQLQMSREAADFAISEAGWDLQSYGGWLQYREPPSWVGHFYFVDIPVSGLGSDVSDMLGYELNGEALTWGPNFYLYFHTDENVGRLSHKVCETPNNYGVISGGMGGVWAQCTLPDWGRFSVEVFSPHIIWDTTSVETVLTPAGTNTWESNQLWQPFVMYDEGVYKMWYAGTPGTSGQGYSGIGYATSTDGVTWTNRQKVHGPSTWSYERSDSPFVIKEDGTYRMWHRDYYEWLSGCPEGSEWSGYVSHMTSSNGTGWFSHQQILSAQGQSEFQGDGYNIDSISVLKEGNQYTMWYSVHDCPLSGRDYYPPKIWRATSSDGITWENRQLSLPYIEGSWEHLVYDPHVVRDGDGGYLMFYTAYSGEAGQQLAVATSTDGENWIYRQPIGVAGRSPFYFEDIDGTPYLYFSRGDELHEGYEIVRMRGTKVVENQPPIAICQDVTVPTDSGVCTAAVAPVDAGSYDPDGDPITTEQTPVGPYPQGSTDVTLTVTDDKDASDTCSATVEVVDQEPPTIKSLVVSPDTLWPANHKMVPVEVAVSVSDNCDAELNCQITSVAAYEPEATTSDWEITGNLTFDLRAERSGSGDGRVYTITVQCTDAAGNTSSATVDVSVPHDQGKGKKKGKK